MAAEIVPVWFVVVPHRDHEPVRIEQHWGRKTAKLVRACEQDGSDLGSHYLWPTGRTMFGIGAQLDVKVWERDHATAEIAYVRQSVLIDAAITDAYNRARKLESRRTAVADAWVEYLASR
jgi:hypothetical protein